MKKEIGKCPYGVLQINDNKLELVTPDSLGFNHIIYAIDLDKVWEEVKPYFIKKIKELKKDTK